MKRERAIAFQDSARALRGKAVDLLSDDQDEEPPKSQRVPASARDTPEADLEAVIMDDMSGENIFDFVSQSLS